jgi:hypothetical protein
VDEGCKELGAIVPESGWGMSFINQEEFDSFMLVESVLTLMIILAVIGMRYILQSGYV